MVCHTDGRAVLLLHAHTHTPPHTLRGHFTPRIHANIYKCINCLVVKLPVASQNEEMKIKEFQQKNNQFYANFGKIVDIGGWQSFHASFISAINCSASPWRCTLTHA